MSGLEFIKFPSVSNASDDGLLAMGGDLNINTLVSAYSQGIFPWFNDDQPVLWWSPDPRMVLFPSEVKISRSLAKKLRQHKFSVSSNRAFKDVINACALRGEQNPLLADADTWITDEMEAAYYALHQQGYAHSVEVWQNERLVGGLYGVALGNVFFGESMFSRVSDASKVALVRLCQALYQQGFSIIDCQVANPHLFTLGAREISRSEFMQHLEHIDIQQKKAEFSDKFMKTMQDNVITKA